MPDQPTNEILDIIRRGPATRLPWEAKPMLHNDQPGTGYVRAIVGQPRGDDVRHQCVYDNEKHGCVVNEALFAEDGVYLVAAANHVRALLVNKEAAETNAANLKTVIEEDTQTIEELTAEVERLKKLLDRDHTGLAAGLVAVRKALEGWAWIPAGEWGCYEEHEQSEAALREEVGRAFEEADRLAEKALRDSGVRADAAFRPEKDQLAAVKAERDRLREAFDGEEESHAETIDALESAKAERDACHALFDAALRAMGYQPDGGRPGLVDAVERMVTERDSLRAVLVALRGSSIPSQSPDCPKHHRPLVRLPCAAASGCPECLIEERDRLSANIDAIVKVCALAGIGSEGQTVLCRVKDLHEQLGHQIERADKAEAETRQWKRYAADMELAADVPRIETACLWLIEALRPHPWFSHVEIERCEPPMLRIFCKEPVRLEWANMTEWQGYQVCYARKGGGT